MDEGPELELRALGSFAWTARGMTAHVGLFVQIPDAEAYWMRSSENVDGAGMRLSFICVATGGGPTAAKTVATPHAGSASRLRRHDIASRSETRADETTERPRRHAEQPKSRLCAINLPRG